MDPLDELTSAADAADALLAVNRPYEPHDVVVRDPKDVWFDEEVFVFGRASEPIDSQMLAVDRATGMARFVQYPLLGPDPFPRLRPFYDAPEGDPEGPLTIVLGPGYYRRPGGPEVAPR